MITETRMAANSMTLVRRPVRLLEPLSDHLVPAITIPFMIRNHFKNTGPVRFATIWPEFKQRFLDKTENAAPDARLRKYELLEIAPDGPIPAELGGETAVETTLGAAFAFLRRQGGGAGIAFLIQSAGYKLGMGGGGIGYIHITNSLDIEFDTFNNGTQNGVPGDINGNHVAVNVDGVLNDPVSTPIVDPLNNGKIWYAWIDYEGVSQDLQVRLSEVPVRPLTNVLETTVNLPAILGGTNAFVGFTAGTGSAYNEQDILAWKFMALPTTRFTGAFALTNLPPGFFVRSGLVLDQYTYVVAGIHFTNYTYAPVTIATNSNGQIAFASDLGNFGPDALDDAINSNAHGIEGAISNNAAALDALDADLNSFAMLAAYDNSTTPEEGALLNSYNDGTGYPEFLQNADFHTVYPLYEDDFLNIMNQTAANPPPGLFPPPALTQLAAAGANQGGNSAPLLSPANADGNANGWTTTFSSGKEVGTVTTRQQVVYSSPLPLLILSPRQRR